MYKVSIHVTLKQGVLDPQGKAVKNSLHTLGFDGVADVRIGKFIEVEVDALSREQAEQQVGLMCEKLLANPVIEQYRVSVEEVMI